MRIPCISLSALSVAFLAACGGGGGSSLTPAAPPPSGLDREAGYRVFLGGGGPSASSDAAVHRPSRLGSVTQSTNGDPQGVTTDRASASFDGRDLLVRVVRQGQPDLTFSSASDTLPGADSGVIASSLRPVYRYREVGTLGLRGDDLTAAFLGVDWNADDAVDDYLAGGYWIQIDDLAGGSPDFEIGAFVDGPELRGAAPVPGTGTAIYTGFASALFGIEYGTAGPGTPEGLPQGTVGLGSAVGGATLRADFGRDSVSGSITDFRVVDGVFLRPGSSVLESFRGDRGYTLHLDSAAIVEGRFSGTTRLVHPDFEISRSSGAWGGRFSDRPVSAADPDPRLAAGTFGGEARHHEGTEVSFVGVFGATHAE